MTEDTLNDLGKEEKKEFDLTVHHRDIKSKRISKVTDYVRHCQRVGDENLVIYERNGKFFYANNVEVPFEENFVINKKKEEKKPDTQATTQKR